MKKVLMFACALVIAGSSFANTPDVNEKVLKAFKATFTDAENVEWSDASSLYTVRFTHQGIRTFVKYYDDGNFISCRRYYNAETLPVDIQCKLKKRFADKKIFGVTEYTVGDEINYYVSLEDKKNWMTVKIDSGRNMEITEKYGKL
jgi:hypothetical protein